VWDLGRSGIVDGNVVVTRSSIASASAFCVISISRRDIGIVVTSSGPRKELDYKTEQEPFSVFAVFAFVTLLHM
jgi:hypothetical protein